MSLHLEQLVLEVKQVAIEAGHFLRQERARFDRSAVQEKGPHDYVSYVDKASEERLVAQLSSLLPEAGFITEEKTTRQCATEEYCWVIDPLDGTTNFIHDMAPYCVSIALRDSREVLLGVVYEVCRDECYWAYKGGGAYLNDRPIHVSSVSDIRHAQILLGFPYDSERFRPIVLSAIEQMYGMVGAERLLGKGDMLYAPVSAIKPLRVQGAFVDGKKEVTAVTQFIKSAANVAYDEAVMEKIEQEAKMCGVKKKKVAVEDESGAEDDDKDDPIKIKAIEVALEYGTISTSLLQRRLSLGYAKAARIVDKLERSGVIGEFDPTTKKRAILITPEEFAEMKLNSKSGEEE